MSRREPKAVSVGDVIGFRLPSDTPNEVIVRLNKLKLQLERNYSAKLAQIFLEGVKREIEGENTLRIPLPNTLTPEQTDWLSNSMTQRMLQQLVVQLAQDPISALHKMIEMGMGVSEAASTSETESVSNAVSEPTVITEVPVQQEIVDETQESVLQTHTKMATEVSEVAGDSDIASLLSEPDNTGTPALQETDEKQEKPVEPYRSDLQSKLFANLKN
ncbi:hypothetical protein [Alicyclobacillus fodiniaquatilis]|uniref:Uncharacterized protein n=1 Tax=Alicyclobacillus fodiniaquatilis TaxID=1661150 RepID=A0ABW4JFU2_9BACL